MLIIALDLAGCAHMARRRWIGFGGEEYGAISVRHCRKLDRKSRSHLIFADVAVVDKIIDINIADARVLSFQ
ncbi:MAG TPA: hypothetical protein VK603_08670 [Candidatus Saccharimonadales bacterium]|nr:hypothetical protein [Candidatus Saccharimonadales bacterium]